MFENHKKYKIINLNFYTFRNKISQFYVFLKNVPK